MKLIADLHTHSIHSGHSFGTIEEMGRQASLKELKYIAVTDHGPALKGSVTELHFRCAHLCPAKINNTIIYMGVESNILDYNGKLDLSPEILDKLDIVLAGFHDYCGYTVGSKQENTKAMIAVMENKRVDVISHIGNPVYPINYDEAVKAAKDNGTLIEINNRSFLPGKLSSRKGSETNCRKVMQLCIKYNVKVVVNSDAHNQFQIGCCTLALNILKEEQFPIDLILNSNAEKLATYMNSIHTNKRPKEILE